MQRCQSQKSMAEVRLVNVKKIYPFVSGEEDKKKKRTSLKSILGGDILATDFFRRQTKLLVLIMVFIIFYIHNRYASQQQQIEIDRLKKELIDIKYDALTRSSELMEKSRQSRIEEYQTRKVICRPLPTRLTLLNKV